MLVAVDIVGIDVVGVVIIPPQDNSGVIITKNACVAILKRLNRYLIVQDKYNRIGRFS